MDALPRPSSWPVRNERRHIATVNAHRELNNKLDTIAARFDCLLHNSEPPGLENSSTSQVLAKMCSRIDKLENVVNQGFTNISFLMTCIAKQQSNDTSQMTESRLGRLETLLLCDPQFSPDVDTVLMHLLDKRGNRSEPEKELSPIKEHTTTGMKDDEMVPNVLNLDFYEDFTHTSDKLHDQSSEKGNNEDNTQPLDPIIDPSGRCKQIAETITSELHTSHGDGKNDKEDLLAECEAIMHKIEQQLVPLFEEKKFDEIEQIIYRHCDSIIVACPMMPRTAASREDIRKKYGNHDKYWLWPRICKRYHKRQQV